MALTAGVLTQDSVSPTQAVVESAVAVSGTTPYSYAWYQSTVTGFTPGGSNVLTGVTGLGPQTISGLTPGTQYYYKVVVTDSAGTPATATSSQLSVLTTQPVLDQNQFAQVPFLGQMDLRFNPSVVEVVIDSSQSGVLYAGQAVKMVDNAGGVPKVIGCSANSDEVYGFITYDIKNKTYSAGDACTMALRNSVMFLYATEAIARGVQVQLAISTKGGVATKTGSSGADIVGWAYDKASAAGQLIRIWLDVPSFAKA